VQVYNSSAGATSEYGSGCVKVWTSLHVNMDAEMHCNHLCLAAEPCHTSQNIN